MTDLVCAPRWATPRNFDRPTYGEQAQKFSAALGTPLMDWQRYVLDVSLERDPITDLPAYRNVIVTVPRQSGKTSLILVLFLVRALSIVRQQIVYTAQDRSEAKKKMVNDWLPLLAETNFANYFDVTQANGNEAMRFHNGSLLSLIATTKRAAHGKVTDLGVVDEAFALPDARMEQSIVPSMVTRPDAQFWLVSTAGTFAESPYLWEKVQQGRKLVEDHVTSGTAYFEWSADDDDDPGSEDTWRRCMPALGKTQSVEIIRSIYESMELSEFRRAFLNQWVAAATDPVISLERWDELVTDEVESFGQWALAFDVAEDRSMSSIAASWKREDGKYQVVLIDNDAGTNWVATRVADIWHANRPSGIWLDRNGPAGSLLSALENLNVPLVNDVPVGDLAKGCGQFYDACIEGNLVHLDDPVLRVTLDAAQKRSVSDSWVWSRKASNVDISPLVACTMALYGAMSMSRTPSVFSVREIMEEKRARQEALDAVADAVTNPIDVTPNPQDNRPHVKPTGELLAPGTGSTVRVHRI